MRKMLVLLALVVMLPLGSCTITVDDPIYDSTTADVGTSRTVSVTMRTDSGTDTATISFVPSSSYLTAVTDSGGSQYDSVSITTSGVTKTFTMTGSSAGTFSFYIKATTSTGGGAQSNIGYIEYVSPDSLTLSVAEDPSSTYSGGETVGIVVNVQNQLSSTQSRNMTLWFSTSGFTVAGDPESATISLGAGQTSQKIWNVTLPTLSSTQYAYVRLGDNTQAATITFTKQSSGSGSSNTGTTTSSTTTSTISLEPSKSVTLDFGSIMINGSKTKTISNENISVTAVNISLNMVQSNVQVTVKALDSQPSSVSTPSGSVYQYMSISSQNLASAFVNRVRIRFRIPVSWLASENVDPDSISLYRYTNGWDKLETMKTSEDDSYAYYEAETPGFSYFAVMGSQLPESEEEESSEEGEETEDSEETGTEEETSEEGTASEDDAQPETSCGNAICDAGESADTCPQDCQVVQEEEKGLDFGMIAVIVIVIAALAGLAYWYTKKQ